MKLPLRIALFGTFTILTFFTQFSLGLRIPLVFDTSGRTAYPDDKSTLGQAVHLHGGGRQQSVQRLFGTEEIGGNPADVILEFSHQFMYSLVLNH